MAFLCLASDGPAVAEGDPSSQHIFDSSMLLSLRIAVCETLEKMGIMLVCCHTGFEIALEYRNPLL